MNDPRNIFWDQRNYKEDEEAKKTTIFNEETDKPVDREQTVEERVEEMKKLASKYQKEGEGQLIRDIINNVVEQKARGLLSNDQLIAFSKRVFPLLNEEQRQRLQQLMDQLLKL